MQEQAAATLGEPVEFTTIASPKGHGKKIMTVGVVAQQVGGVAGVMAAERAIKTTSTVPAGAGGYMVVALTESRLAFFEMKRGLLKNSAGKLLAEHPRATVTRFELGGGALTSELTVEFADGTHYALEVPRANKGGAEKMAAALG